jgi:hypothetical protein
MKKLNDIRDEILKTSEARASYEEERALLMQEIADEDRDHFASRQSETISVSMHI